MFQFTCKDSFLCLTLHVTIHPYTCTSIYNFTLIVTSYMQEPYPSHLISFYMYGTHAYILAFFFTCRDLIPLCLFDFTYRDFISLAMLHFACRTSSLYDPCFILNVGTLSLYSCFSLHEGISSLYSCFILNVGTFSNYPCFILAVGTSSLYPSFILHVGTHLFILASFCM